MNEEECRNCRYFQLTAFCVPRGWCSFIKEYLTPFLTACSNFKKK